MTDVVCKVQVDTLLCAKLLCLAAPVQVEHWLQVRKYVMEEVNKAGKAKKLRGFEMIKAVLLDEEPWSGMTYMTCTHSIKHLPSAYS